MGTVQNGANHHENILFIEWWHTLWRPPSHTPSMAVCNIIIFYYVCCLFVCLYRKLLKNDLVTSIQIVFNTFLVMCLVGVLWLSVFVSVCLLLFVFVCLLLFVCCCLFVVVCLLLLSICACLSLRVCLCVSASAYLCVHLYVHGCVLACGRARVGV